MIFTTAIADIKNGTHFKSGQINSRIIAFLFKFKWVKDDFVAF